MTVIPHGTSTRKLISYSIAVSDACSSEHLAHQLNISFGSLRSHNDNISVVLFCHGFLSKELSELCRYYDVHVHQTEPYEILLRRYSANGAAAMAHYPLLHKFMNFEPLLAWGIDQVLCCDCDTVFFRDPEKLFDHYGRAATLVAREEVGSSRNHHGPNTEFLNETLLAQLADHECVSHVPPFNLGLVLINELNQHDWLSCQSLVVDYAWRFVSWMASNPLPANAPYAEFDGLADARQVLTALDVQRALPFPSNNRWILDEAALWLALGRLNGISTSDFLQRDVVQNGEMDPLKPDPGTATVWHYFSSNSAAVDIWLCHRQLFYPQPETPEEMYHGWTKEESYSA